MSIPVSSGIGTGAAQVYSMDKTYDALKDVGQSVANAAEYRRREEAIKAKDKAALADKKVQLDKDFVKNYSYDDFSKLAMKDIPKVKASVASFHTKWRSKGEEIANGGEAYLEAMKEWNDIQGFVADSMNEKEQLAKVGDDINKNPDKYDDATVTMFNEVYKSGNLRYNSWGQHITQKINLPSTLDLLSKQIKDPKVLLKGTVSRETDAGTYADKGIKYQSQEEMLAYVEPIISASPETLASIERDANYIVEKNPDISIEDARKKAKAEVVAAYAAANLPPQTVDITNTTKKQKVKETKENPNAPRVTIKDGIKILSFPKDDDFTGEVDIDGKKETVRGRFNNYRVKNGVVYATLTRVGKDAIFQTKEVKLGEALYGKVAAKLKVKGKIGDYINSMNESSEIWEGEPKKDGKNSNSKTGEGVMEATKIVKTGNSGLY